MNKRTDKPQVPIRLLAPRQAVALKYSQEEQRAPRVSARGRGEAAERILAAAKEHGVPVQQDADLLELLTLSEIGDEIPAELYSAVAELLTYLWRLNEELRSAPAGKE